jgi:hypothetical protein
MKRHASISVQTAKRLTGVAKSILARPEHFGMDNWLLHDESVSPSLAADEPWCGTTACIAGHAILLAGIPMAAVNSYSSTISVTKTPWPLRKYVESGNGILNLVAQGILGLSEDQASGLFHVIDWPLGFRRRYMAAEAADDHLERARVTADRIKHFIEKGV